MPKLPFPLGCPVDGGELPVSSDADVAAQEADFVAQSENAPIRDAIRAAAAKMMLKYQSAATKAAAQASTLRATGVYLEEKGRERYVFKQPGETTVAYRKRVNTPPRAISPNAIVAAANAILAPYTSVSAKYLESILDRGYISDGSATWQSFIDVGPYYPDRLYSDDPAGGIPYRDPGGFWVFGDNVGRYLILRVPDLSGLDDANGFVFDGQPTGQSTSTIPEVNGEGFWVQDGSSATVASFIGPSGIALDVYQAIANTVDRLVGDSIRWMLYADPTLV